MFNSKHAKELTDFIAKAADDARANKCDFISNLEINSQCPWKEDDRKWFKKNRNCNYRLRRLALGELPEWAVENNTHVVIKQIKQGLRDKRLITDMVKGRHLDAVPQNEELVSALWQKANFGGGLIIPFGNIWLAKLGEEEMPS